MSNTQPYTVMTVCTGNICRSPMGEIILRHFFNERGLGDQVNVESSGVSDEEWSVVELSYHNKKSERKPSLWIHLILHQHTRKVHT